MERSRFLVTGMLVLAAIVGLNSWASAAPMDDLIAAARKEGAIDLLAPSTLTPPGAEALGQAFNKKYGLNIQLNYIPSAAMPRDVAKVISQTAAGMAPECDVIVVMDAHHRLVTTTQEKAEMVNRLAREYGKMLGFN